MTWIRILVSVAGLGMCLVPTSAAAQTACRSADSASVRMVQWVKNIATGTNDQANRLRTQTKIPFVSASQVLYVSDKTVCTKTLTPYNNETVMTVTATGAAVPPSGKVYVVKAGTIYVVWDPAKSAGDYAVYVTLDSKYKVLWSGVG